MGELYHAHGVSFEYPDDWEIAENETDSELFISVSGPETSFWSLSLFHDRPDPEHVVNEAVQAYRSEYDELDEYRSETQLAGHPGTACDLEFVCLELINSAFMRTCQTGRFTALVLYQGTDHELETTKPLLEAITRTLAFDHDEQIIP